MESPQKDGLKQSPCSKKTKFAFTPPPEAPVFKPTEEEFEDPLKYINKISNVGKAYGIIKIIPPEGWKPPFALNYDNFKFKPRIQKINELEAHTRIKLNFMIKVAHEVAKKGKLPKVPFVEKAPLDLFTLNKLVDKEGGYELVGKDKKWGDIAKHMGLTNKVAAVQLKSHYETWLLPYTRRNIRDDSSSDSDNDVVKLTNIRELKSLEFLGPGPKMPICNYNFSTTMKTRTRHKKVQYEFDPLAKYMCQTCGLDDSEGSLATCKNCDDKYHMVCLVPQLSEQPKDWLCPKCIVATDPANPFEEFGFETAEKEYSLKQFGQMADKFKQQHFKMPGRLVPTDKVEKEYWRIMGSMESDVTVEYGADLSTMDVGSGFPTRTNLNLDGYEREITKKYAESKWNLNNLSVLGASALRHITSNISGMKVPWAYVGMCFSTFCWHNEDHWSYSINYLHWGEPKTWYGVSGLDADIFEAKMRELAPELFAGQPDLLHQLVTNMNPNLLMDKNLSIFRTDQNEGEFVVTFPRAYHAGFNQGFNFAEACNFAPADWIRIGRESVIYYSLFQRNCVFSHDELICNIVENLANVDKELAVAAYLDMKDMINSEILRRKKVLKDGITKKEKDDFSSEKDDNRQCHVCKTTCFLSAIFCPCSPDKLVCLDHINKYCTCDPSKKVLKYQFTVPELVAMHIKFIETIDDFDTWLDLIKAVYQSRETKPPMLSRLVKDSGKNHYPNTEFLQKFKADVALTLRCAGISRFVIQNIIKKKDPKHKLSLDDLNVLHKVFLSLPWSIPEVKSIERLISSVKNFQLHLKELLQSKNSSRRLLESCLNVGNLLNVTFEELPILEKKLKEKFESEEKIENNHQTKGIDIDNLKKVMNATVESEKINEEVNKVNDLLVSITKWNAKVSKIFNSKEKKDLSELEELLSEGHSLKVDSPCMEKLSGLISEAEKWTDKCQKLLMDSNPVCLLKVEELVKSGKLLPFKLAMITDLEIEYGRTKKWLDRMKETFCYKSSQDSLLETLWPRKFKLRSHYQCRRTLEEPAISSKDPPTDFSDDSIRMAHEEEFKSLMSLRWENYQKKSSKFEANKSVCICGEEIDGSQVCCELCQTEYHIKCFIGDDNFNKNFFTLPYKNLYCSYCIRTKRPLLSVVEKCLSSAEGLILKVPEYYILKYYFSVYSKWSKEVQKFLNARDITIAMQKVNSHVPKNYLDLPLIQLTNKKLLEIKSLVLQIDVLEVTIPEIVKLWALLEATKVDSLNRKRVNTDDVHVSPPPEIKKPKLSKENSPKKRTVVRKRGNTGASSEMISKMPINTTRLPDSLMDKFTDEQLNEYMNEERCAAENCLKPIEDEVHWVQCDGQCKLWFHMRCVNVSAHEVKDEDEYVCLKCALSDPTENVSESSKSPDYSFL